MTNVTLDRSQELDFVSATMPSQREFDKNSRLEVGSKPMRARWQRRYVSGLVCADLLVAGCASAVSFAFKFGAVGAVPPQDLIFLLLFPFGFVAAVASVRAYEPRFLGTGTEEYRRVFDAALRYGALVAVVSYGMKLTLSRASVFATLTAAALLSLTLRTVARHILRHYRARGRCQNRVVVVGLERSIAELVRHLSKDIDGNAFNVLGACLDRPRAVDIEGVPVVGRSDDVVERLLELRADTLAVTAWSDLSQADLRRIAWRLEGTGVSILMAPRLADIAGPRIHVRPVAGLPMLNVEEPAFRGGRRVLKSLLERFAALVILIGLSPILAVIAVAIRLTSRGPAFFRQTRIGVHGRDFTIFKFRTMHLNSERALADIRHLNESDGILFKIKQDPRVTRIGRTLRRYSIDEVPQLINVVLGSMSLVGPRPPLEAEVSEYPSDVHRRLLVKPGLTGLWQISGRSELSWDESVRLDLYYIENWSPALDLSIIWRTISAVVKSRGAY